MGHHWTTNPVKWCCDILGDQLIENYGDTQNAARKVWLWDKQVEILKAVSEHRRVTVKGCFQSSKTFVAARAVLWFLYTNPKSVVVTTAPGNRQVEHLLWKEIRDAYANSRIILGGRLLNKSIEYINRNPRWYAIGFATSDRNAAITMRGFHAPKILVVVDEACGVSQDIYDAIEGLLGNEGAKLLLVGNPLIAQGGFYDSFTSPLYHNITISAFDTPNVKVGKELIPGMISKQWVEEREKEWGLGSALYQSKVLGEFPVAGTDTLIPLRWIELAEKRWEDPEYGFDEDDELVAGIDPGGGGFGSDPTAYCFRRGNRVLEFQRTCDESTMQTVGKCKLLQEQGYRLNVDVLGIGAGIGDRLNEQGIPFREHRGSNKTREQDRTGYMRFNNMRSAVWWKMREAFDPDGEIKIAVPKNADLRKDLTTPKFKHESNSTIVLESKDSVKNKLGRSPDYGDALSMTMSVQDRVKATVINF